VVSLAAVTQPRASPRVSHRIWPNASLAACPSYEASARQEHTREAGSSGLSVRSVLAIILAAFALGGAVFLATVHLKTHGHYHCVSTSGTPGSCDPAYSYWVVGRFVWQIPAAIAIAAVGLGGAAALAKRTGVSFRRRGST
jgi:hypothetical protein